MLVQKFVRLATLASIIMVTGLPIQSNVLFQDPISLINLSFFGMYRPEMFVWDRATFLNRDEINDFFWLARHTCDLGLNITDKDVIVEFNFVIRNKGVWGNAGTIARTIPKVIKILDSPLVPQSFSLPRYIFWMREGWLRFNLGKLFGLKFKCNHYFTLGAFPFSLGRGISLGDAYAVGPELLGFYSDTVVDQYAFGFLFSGELIKDTLDYNFYGALLQTKADNLANTSDKVRIQQYNRRSSPSRGPNILNYLFAGNVNWYPIKSEAAGSLRLQPYWLFNEDDEQRIDFEGDAKSRLGTIGLEIEYLGNRIEVGVEGAFNLGHQTVRGWDRNAVQLQSIDGRVSQVNSHVVDSNGAKIPFVADDPAQKAIFSVNPGENENGQQIPGDFPVIGFLMPPDGQIFNGKDRFRDPYCNEYNGWMIISDASLWVYKKDLKFAVTLGAASGDDNPNFDTKDRNFEGFIGLQEIYAGKRVKSAFFLGGHGKVVRPIANPFEEDDTNILTETVSGFTNLILGGFGLTWSPTDWEKPFKINPNCLFYWQHQSVPLSPIRDRCFSSIPLANSFLGTELNVFMDCNIVKNLKLYGVMSIFIPGQFYQDIQGRRDIVAELIKSNLDDLRDLAFDEIPRFGSDTALTFNFGIEYRF